MRIFKSKIYDQMLKSSKVCGPGDARNAYSLGGVSRRNEPNDWRVQAAPARGRAPEHGVEWNNTVI